MDTLPKSLNGLPKELLDFMRGCESLLSFATTKPLSDDEVEIVRYYVQWLNEKCRR
jgi:hypothetical protein